MKFGAKLSELEGGRFSLIWEGHFLKYRKLKRIIEGNGRASRVDITPEEYAKVHRAFFSELRTDIDAGNHSRGPLCSIFARDPAPPPGGSMGSSSLSRCSLHPQSPSTLTTWSALWWA